MRFVLTLLSARLPLMKPTHVKVTSNRMLLVLLLVALRQPKTSFRMAKFTLTRENRFPRPTGINNSSNSKRRI